MAPGDFQRRCRNIGCGNSGMRQFVCHRNSEASRTSADVADSERRTWGAGLHIDLDSARSEAFQCDFDNMFGLRARNEHGRRNFKFEPPEFLLAGEVLSRLARSSPLDPREITIEGCRLERVFGMGVDPGAV